MHSGNEHDTILQGQETIGHMWNECLVGTVVLQSCQLEIEHVPMMTTGCKSTCSKKSMEGGQMQTPKPERPLEQTTQPIQTSTLSRYMVERGIE